MSVATFTPKYDKLGEGFSHRERLKADEAPGRPWNRVAGGWISDLCSLQKHVMLCPFCLSKFNPKSYGYEPWRTAVPITSIGKCDGCNQPSMYLKNFIHEEFHQDIGEWQSRPRRGRWARS